MTQENLYISSSPHAFSSRSTSGMMRDVIIALMPAVFASVYFFKIKAVMLISVSIIACAVFESAYRALMKKKVTLSDGSAVLTGILFALISPPTLPLWTAAIGCFVAVVLGKQLFGGLGLNIFNPALLGRAFLMAAFPAYMTRWTNPITLDAVTTATPLGMVKFGHNFNIDYYNLFMGKVSGSLGEASAVLLILGGIYLLIRKTIDWRIPISYIGTVLVISFITNTAAPDTYAGPLFQVLAGGLMLGAFFMATDPVTTPVTKKGRFVFGAGCGLVTMIIRLWGGLPEGVMYSILFMNALTPLINRITRPRRYGT